MSLWTQDNDDVVIPKFKKLRKQRTLILGDDPEEVTKEIKFPKDLIYGIMSDYYCPEIVDNSILSQCAYIECKSLTQLSSKIRSILDTFDVVLINRIDMMWAPGDNLKKDRGSIIRGLLAKAIRPVIDKDGVLILTSLVKETATIESVDSVIRC